MGVLGLGHRRRFGGRNPQNITSPDFSNWKNHDAFECAFARLEKDLRGWLANNRPGRDNRKLARHKVSGNVP
jgi:hypothetical protein